MPRHRTPTRSQSALTVARATSPSLHWQHGSVRQTYQQAITKFLSPAQVRRLLDDVRTLAHAHLDMDRAVRQQAPGKWDAFIRQATQDFPIFARFPNSWPLRDYITRHIANRRSTLRAGSGKSKGRDEKMEKENTDARVDGGGGGSKTEKAVGLREVGQTVRGTKTYISETFGRARNLLQSADASQVYVEVPVPPKPPAPQVSAPFSASEPSTLSDHSQHATSTLVSGQAHHSWIPHDQPDSDYVEAFLSRLSPPLTRLRQTFDRVGIDEQCLREMPIWPPERLDPFIWDLVKSGELKPVHADTIKWGLRDVVSHVE